MIKEQIALALETHLTDTWRVMGEVLARDEKARDIWDQDADIMQAIIAGDGDNAEALVRSHPTQAALHGHALAGQGRPRLRGRGRGPHRVRSASDDPAVSH